MPQQRLDECLCMFDYFNSGVIFMLASLVSWTASHLLPCLPIN